MEELTYSKCGDYYLPNLALPDMPERPIGKYGHMHRRYLQKSHPIVYSNLVLSGKLWHHLAEIDLACNERMERIVSAMRRQEGVTEELKASSQMEWVRRMNSIQNRAEETILTELVYSW